MSSRSDGINDNDNDDRIYLGFQSLDIDVGVCPQVMPIFSSNDLSIETPNILADRNRYIIRDFLSDTRFNTTPYVTEWPHFRSYAAVPLISEAGYIIGSYCVLDNQSRDFDTADVKVLRSISSCVTNHLELLKTKQDFNRVEKLVRGIASYVAGYSGLQEQQTRCLVEKSTSARRESGSGSQRSLPHSRSRRRSSLSSSRPSSKEESTDAGASTPPTSADESLARRARSRSPVAHPGWQNSKEKDERNMTSISQAVRITFSRAGNLIRQSMYMQGVAFLVSLSTAFDHHELTSLIIGCTRR